MITHKTGEYEIIHNRKFEVYLLENTVIGDTTNEKVIRHYLKQSDLDATDWFKEWKKQRDEEDKKYAEEYSKKMDKLYAEEYYEEFRKEMDEKYETTSCYR